MRSRGLTIDEATQLRAAWLAAELAVATGQSYTIAGRTLTRADAKFIHQQFVEYDRILAALQDNRRDGINIFRVMPRDF